jgi:hypothetical protein
LVAYHRPPEIRHTDGATSITLESAWHLLSTPPPTFAYINNHTVFLALVDRSRPTQALRVLSADVFPGSPGLNISVTVEGALTPSGMAAASEVQHLLTLGIVHNRLRIEITDTSLLTQDWHFLTLLLSDNRPQCVQRGLVEPQGCQLPLRLLLVPTEVIDCPGPASFALVPSASSLPVHLSFPRLEEPWNSLAPLEAGVFPPGLAVRTNTIQGNLTAGLYSLAFTTPLALGPTQLRCHVEVQHSPRPRLPPGPHTNKKAPAVCNNELGAAFPMGSFLCWRCCGFQVTITLGARVVLSKLGHAFAPSANPRDSVSVDYAMEPFSIFGESEPPACIVP